MIAKKLLLTALILVIALIACATKPVPTPPPRPEGPLPKGAAPITAIPPDYAVWFGEVKECVGYSRVEFQSIKWYMVLVKDDRGFRWPDPPKDTLWVAGLAYSQLTAIVMGDLWVLKAPEIRHEIMHLAASPYGHDAELYQRKCKHLVTCVGACRSDTLNTR